MDSMADGCHFFTGDRRTDAPTRTRQLEPAMHVGVPNVIIMISSREHSEKKKDLNFIYSARYYIVYQKLEIQVRTHPEQPDQLVQRFINCIPQQMPKTGIPTSKISLDKFGADFDVTDVGPPEIRDRYFI